MNTKMPLNIARAVKKYGTLNCYKAHKHNRVYGEGPSTIAQLFGTNVNGANAMINAGQWLHENDHFKSDVED